MAFFPLSFLRSFAYAGTSVVLFAVVGALITLPAALGMLGPRINALRVRRNVGTAARGHPVGPSRDRDHAASVARGARQHRAPARCWPGRPSASGSASSTSAPCRPRTLPSSRPTSCAPTTPPSAGPHRRHGSAPVPVRRRGRLRRGALRRAGASTRSWRRPACTSAAPASATRSRRSTRPPPASSDIVASSSVRSRSPEGEASSPRASRAGPPRGVVVGGLAAELHGLPARHRPHAPLGPRVDPRQRR